MKKGIETYSQFNGIVYNRKVKTTFVYTSETRLKKNIMIKNNTSVDRNRVNSKHTATI